MNSETWSIAAMTCSQDRRGGISRGVFCPRIHGNENRLNMQAKPRKQAFIKFSPLIPEYLGRIKMIKNKKGSKYKKSLAIIFVMEW